MDLLKLRFSVRWPSLFDPLRFLEMAQDDDSPVVYDCQGRTQNTAIETLALSWQALSETSDVLTIRCKSADMLYKCHQGGVGYACKL